MRLLNKSIVRIGRKRVEKMKVYELIQELCSYDADCEVEISCQLDKVDVDITDEDGEEKTVQVDFTSNSDVEVTSEKSYYRGTKEKVILSAYYE